MNTSNFPFHFKFEMRHDPSRMVYEVMGTGVYTGRGENAVFLRQATIPEDAALATGLNIYDLLENEVMRELMHDMMDHDKRIPKPL